MDGQRLRYLVMKKHCFFIHIGKTGGTSTTAYLERAIASCTEWIYEHTIHLTAEAIKEKFGAVVFDKALKFSIVRHPVDRYISACRQCEVDANSPKTWDRIRHGIHPHDGGEPEYHIFVTQVDSTFVDNQQACQIFKFEKDLPHGVFAWLKAQGLVCPEFPHKLPGEGFSPPKQELTAEALAFVKDFYACDFKVFGYEP